METCLLCLPQKLLLMGVAALTMSALETADLVDLCGQTWQGDRLLLPSHSESHRFYFMARDTDCRLWMWAEAPGNRISFQFHFILVYSLPPATPVPLVSLMLNTSSLEWDPCARGSYLQFYEGPPETPQPLGAPLCGLTIPVPVTSSGPSLGLRLVTRGHQPHVDFVGEVTSFQLEWDAREKAEVLGMSRDTGVVERGWALKIDKADFKPQCFPFLMVLPQCLARPRAQMAATLCPILFPVLGSAGPLGIATKRSSAGQDPVLQDATKDPQLWKTALASSVFLASTGLLLGLFWCCCFPCQLAGWAGAQGHCFSYSAACTACYACPGQAAPEELRPSGPAF
ncbi:LOW QUALITY PROTEIN: low-density lipoprotein receptor class A domain-containing protein 2 [Orycteropus afer afer]|uniref:LOW QUALITY PROTEIN: low-density lipoprotein receptor class A domain-containing protein 2 n=1 Tax=Orycteropus afer afer TaxID=1230840 RepID=A0A8B6ZEG3_ORYAF|nr:LOW QUALITY PROTEIN: low-density lipoprotein receptor class A domain-containing protein 2 [Orycteropus afer afer]